MPQPVMPVDQPPAAPDAGIPSPAAVGANVVGADQGTAAAPTALPAPAGAGTLTITFPSGQAYVMQGDEINVGRSDVAQNWHPELDVIPYGGGAPDLGVSRHQARLIRQNGGFAVVDVGSTNGTYVNGRAVPYNQPTPLHDGDTLSFGALNTHVSIT
jgi:pSer/pThr/pTyr-binding forkhead associated (FHA) protein